ncbi:ABC transporter substrate-binding protein [Actinopolymorpha pittospori]|uniref:Multiple sugar transport system substrate-binding protein n=1 Tax=Actinopolymorpha pittospori TaxID=648752 RepID=A0A927RET4_9ACTN|nr:sugar ABC transporter substrate-binding protein [Actinopolymorpha pittospori]MBE1609510.1 multiple sugar transport system substrate-binding protein [Actinopolymorpha pittospori]
MTTHMAPLSRRSLLGGALGLAGGSLLLGCGKSGGGGSGDGITMLNWEQTAGTPLEKAIREYEKQSGTKVTIQPAVTGDAYDTKMRTLLAGGDPPDVMRINDDFVRGFSDQGALLDLNTYVKRDKLDTSQFAKEAFEFPKQADGSHTAWVLGYQPRLIFYNVDMFKEAGVPLPPTTWTSDGWTWDDFADAAKKLTIPGKRYGGLIYLDTGYEQTFAVNHGSATGIFSKDGTQFTLADQKEVEAMQWATDLTCKAHVQPPWSELQQDSIQNQMFAQGKLAMLFTGFGTVPYLRQTIKDFTWDIAPPPGDVEQKTESSVIVFTIAKSAKNPDKAWELLKFLSGEEGGKILLEGGAFTPINLKAAEGLKPGKEAPAHIELFAEAAKHLTATNQTKNTIGARQLYRPALDAAYNCEKSVGDVLKEIKPQVLDALKG